MMNFQQYYQQYLLRENMETNLYGPVYHGGFWTGTTPIKTGGRGALGTGAYFTDNKEEAQTYSKNGAAYHDKGGGNNVVECYLNIKNPLQIRMDEKYEDPCVLLLMLLGMSKDKASIMVEKAYDQHGYVGKQISSRAVSQGYDSIISTKRDGSKEIVIWQAGLVKSAQII